MLRTYYMNIQINYIKYYFDEEKFSLDNMINDIKNYCNSYLDNSIILINLKDNYELNSINKNFNNLIVDLYISLFDDYVVIYNENIHITFTKNEKQNNCVNNFINSILIPKHNDINYYVMKMKEDNEKRSQEISYHKSAYFDKDLTNLRNIKNNCESIIKYINKFEENLTFANYTE